MSTNVNIDSNHEDEHIVRELGSSLQRPTRDFLDKNFTKPQLQKHCREIGIESVWVTKEKLIDFIMVNTNSSGRRESGNEVNGMPTLQIKEII